MVLPRPMATGRFDDCFDLFFHFLVIPLVMTTCPLEEQSVDVDLVRARRDEVGNPAGRFSHWGESYLISKDSGGKSMTTNLDHFSSRNSCLV